LLKMIESGNSALIKNLILIAPAAYPQALPFFITFPRIPVVGRALLSWVSAELQIRMTLNIIFKNKKAYIQAGAGIVADSDPELEYKETLNKARGMFRAIEMAEKELS